MRKIMCATQISANSVMRKVFMRNTIVNTVYTPSYANTVYTIVNTVRCIYTPSYVNTVNTVVNTRVAQISNI